jgi:hypothetical protein
MKNLLEKHQKTDIRYTNKDITFFEPSDEQLLEIKDIIQKSIPIEQDVKINQELDTRSIRFIIRELTNIGAEIDNYSDEELKEKLDNGDRILKLLLREVKKFVNEILDDILEEQIENVKAFNTLMNIINSKQDIKILQNKFNKTMKRVKVDIKFEDFMNLKDNPKAIENLTKKLNIKIK